MEDTKGKSLVAHLVRKYGENNRHVVNACIYKQVQKGKRIQNLTFDEMDIMVGYKLANPASTQGSRSSDGRRTPVAHKKLAINKLEYDFNQGNAPQTTQNRAVKADERSARKRYDNNRKKPLALDLQNLGTNRVQEYDETPKMRTIQHNPNSQLNSLDNVNFGTIKDGGLNPAQVHQINYAMQKAQHLHQTPINSANKQARPAMMGLNASQRIGEEHKPSMILSPGQLKHLIQSEGHFLNQPPSSSESNRRMDVGALGARQGLLSPRRLSVIKTESNTDQRHHKPHALAPNFVPKSPIKASLANQPYSPIRCEPMEQYMDTTRKQSTTIQEGERDGLSKQKSYQRHYNVSMNARLPQQKSPIQPRKVSQTLKEVQQASDGFKTYMQQRDINLVKPRDQKHSMWDMLALKQAIENKKEDQVKKQQQARTKVEMKRFYDSQIEGKKLVGQNEQEYKRDLQTALEMKLKQIDDQDKIGDADMKFKRSNVSAFNTALHSKAQMSIKIDKLNQVSEMAQQHDVANQNLKFRQQVNRVVHKSNMDQVRMETQRQANQDDYRKKDQKNARIQYELDVVNHLEESARKRDTQMDGHLKKIQERDAAIYKHMEQPTIMNQAKLDVQRTQNANKLQENLARLQDYRDFNEERKRNERLNSLKKDMYDGNAKQLLIKEQAKLSKKAEDRMMQSIHNTKWIGNESPMNSDSASYFGKLKTIDATSNGSMGGSPRITTIRQAQHSQDVQTKRLKEMEIKRNYREQLIAQQAEQQHLQDKGRLYMEDKDLATSKHIMAGLNPGLFQNSVRADHTSIAQDDIALRKEVIRLNQSLTSKHKQSIF